MKRILAGIFLIFLASGLVAIVTRSPEAQTHTFPALDTNNIFTGNDTFNGLLQAKNFHTIRIVDSLNSAGWAGADACAWIASAQTDLPATGGIIDATGVTPTATCAGGITLGSASKPVWLQLGNVVLTVNAQVQVLCSNCGITGIQGGSTTTIIQGASFPATTPVIQLSGASVITGSVVSQIRVDCNGVANSIGFENLNGEDFSGFIYDIASGCTKYGFWYDGIGGNPSMAIAEKLWSLHTGTGAIDFFFSNVNNLRGSYLTAVARNTADLSATGITVNGGNVSLDHLHFENCTNCLDIGPSTAAIVYARNLLGHNTATTLVKIENTASNRVNLYELTQNASTNTISDALVNEAIITDSYVTHYETLPGPTAILEKADGKLTLIGGEARWQNAAATIDARAGVGSFSSTGFGLGTATNNVFDLASNNAIGATVEYNGTNSNLKVQNFIRNLETTAPTAIAASDVCYGDSTAHALKCSYNNGTFFNMPQAIASGTSTLTSNAALAAVTSQAAITTAATNTLTTDSIEWSYATAPTAGDSLCHVSPYVTAGNVNFVRTNPTAAAQNVSAIVINWRVIR